MIAGLFLALLGQEVAATPPAWFLSVEPLGWTYLTFTDDNIQLVLTKGAIQPKNSTFRRIWARYEYKVARNYGQSSYLSVVDLDEYDCDAGRSRILQQILYPQHNASGESTSIAPTTPPWNYEIPGSVGEAEMRVACAKTTADLVKPHP